MGPLIRRARLISLSLGVNRCRNPVLADLEKKARLFLGQNGACIAGSIFEYSLLSHRALPGLVEARGARRARPKEFLPRQTHGKNELDFFCFANSARRCDVGADIIRPRRITLFDCQSRANPHRAHRRGRRPRRPFVGYLPAHGVYAGIWICSRRRDDHRSSAIHLRRQTYKRTSNARPYGDADVQQSGSASSVKPT